MDSLSLVTVLGPFILLTEPMMVELSALAAVLAPLKHTHTALGLPFLSSWSIALHVPTLVLRGFAFRLMLSAGLVKWFGSSKWRDLSAMEVSYQHCSELNVTIFAHYCNETGTL